MKKEIIKPLQSFRFIAFMMVFLWHTHDFCHILNGSYASRAVSFFVILSGFMMAYQYSDKLFKISFKEFLKFLWAKIKKFYPLFIITTLIALNGSVLIKNITLDSIFRILKNIFLLQVYFPSNYFDLNGVSWFLSLTVCLYFCSFLIFKIIPKIKNKPILILIGIIISYMCVKMYCNYLDMHAMNASYYAYIFPFVHICQYIIGALICYLFEYLKPIFNKISNSSRKIIFIIFSIIELASIIIYILSIGKYIGTDAFYLQGIHIIFNSCIIFIFSFEKGLFSKIFSNKILVSLGNISFELYIVHQVLLPYAASHNFLNLPGKWFVLYCLLWAFAFVYLYKIILKFTKWKFKKIAS